MHLVIVFTEFIITMVVEEEKGSWLDFPIFYCSIKSSSLSDLFFGSISSIENPSNFSIEA